MGQAIINHFEAEQLRIDSDPEYATAQYELREALTNEIRDADQSNKAARKEARRAEKAQTSNQAIEDQFDDEAADIEIIYVRD